MDFEREKITLRDDIPFAHKIALRDMKEQEPILKYGEIIGVCKSDIKKGQWVHVQNVGCTAKDIYTYRYNEKSVKRGFSDKTFMGYERNSGEAGIRNYIASDYPHGFLCKWSG